MKLIPAGLLALSSALAIGAGCRVYMDGASPNAPGAPAPPDASVAPQPPMPPTAVTAPTTAPSAAQPKRVVQLRLGHGVGPAPGVPVDAGGVAPGACLDKGAASPAADCSKLPAPDSSCVSSSTAQASCSAVTAYFTPKVALAAASCMGALPSKDLCDATRVYGCEKSALANACADSSIAQLCAIAAPACKSTPSDCTTSLSGLNDTGKEQVARCVAQGCAGGLDGCVAGLAAATAQGSRH